MSNMEIRTSVQREIAELEDYIKNNQSNSNYKTKSLIDSNPQGDTVESLKARKTAVLGRNYTISEEKANEIKSGKYDGVKVEISEAGKLQLESNASRQAKSEVTDIASRLVADKEKISKSKLYEMNSNAKALKSYPEYEEALEKESAGFKKAYATQTIGKYADSGIKVDEVDVSYAEKLNALYDKLREEIKGVPDEEEQNARMKSLDDSYKRVFGKNIVNPLKSQYDGQESFYQTGIVRKDSQMEASYNGLKEAKSLYDALLDSNNWHNTDYMKDIIGKLTDAIVSNAKSR